MAAIMARPAFGEIPALLNGTSSKDTARASADLTVHSSLLLRLPQELRDQIIRVHMPSSIVMDPYCVTLATPSPELLQICSQLRLDAAKIYYSTPIYFPWCNPQHFKKWTDTVDDDYRLLVKSVHIDRFFPAIDGAMKHAQEFDAIGRFMPGTVFVCTSIGPTGRTTSVWINALGKSKLYEEMLPLSAAVHSALPDDQYNFNDWL